jgi:hypothetical protein
MFRHGIDVAAAEAPVTALEHARAMASRGHSRGQRHTDVSIPSHHPNSRTRLRQLSRHMRELRRLPHSSRRLGV